MGRLYWQVHKAECHRLARLLRARLTSLGGGWIVVVFDECNPPTARKKQGWGEMRLYLQKLCRIRKLDGGTTLSPDWPYGVAAESGLTEETVDPLQYTPSR